MKFPFLDAKARLVRIMGTFDLATGHGDTMDELLDSLESELRDVLGYYRQRREWVGLTEAQFLEAAQSCLSPHQYDHFESLLENDPDAHNRLARAIEAKLKENNT